MPVDYKELAGGFKPARNGEIFRMNNDRISSFNSEWIRKKWLITWIIRIECQQFF